MSKIKWHPAHTLTPRCWTAYPSSHSVLCVREEPQGCSWAYSDETGVQGDGLCGTPEAAQEAAVESWRANQ